MGNRSGKKSGTDCPPSLGVTLSRRALRGVVSSASGISGVVSSRTTITCHNGEFGSASVATPEVTEASCSLGPKIKRVWDA